MENLSKSSVFPERHWYKNPALKVLFCLFFFVLIAVFFFWGYLNFVYKGVFLVFLLDKFPENGTVMSLIPEKALSSLVFEEMGAGKYFLKLGGRFISLRQDENDNSLLYLGVDTYLGERVEVNYRKNYSRIYWDVASLSNYPTRFSEVRRFSDPSGAYPGWDVVGVGYSYLLPGDFIEADFVIDKTLKEEIESDRGRLSDIIKREQVYFVFAKARE